MIKHIGRHNNKKVVVVFRKIPGDEHLALVVYADSIPSQIHDDVMRALESPVGQQVNEFSEALHRTVLTDGRNALVALHSEGYLKKAQTSQIIMTPDAKSTVRLDELNKIIDEINTGEEAKARLADNDAARGLVDPRAPKKAATPASSGALSDEDIANGMLEQAKRMEAEAKSLLAEAERMLKEASDMLPKPKATATKTTTKRATTAKTTTAKAKKETA